MAGRKSKNENRNSAHTMQALTKASILDFKDLEVWKVGRERRPGGLILINEFPFSDFEFRLSVYRVRA
jgi:hypothetical protein